MAARPQTGFLQNGTDPAPQHRNFRRAAVIGDGGEQAREQALTDCLAGLVELFDADDIKPGRAVNVRGTLCLGHHQQFR